MNEAELLFSRMLKCDRMSLYINKRAKLGAASGAFVSSVLRKRALGYPLQYILGKADFFGRDFSVNEAVLIPRPETEILVDRLVKIFVDFNRVSILDIGTGSGCIAISLAKQLPRARVVASDKSASALKVAAKNAVDLGAKVKFIRSNLFTNIPSVKFDLIVSNPPYIPSNQIKGLQPEISYEPRLALDGGKDGLDYYRKIIKQSCRYLKDNGVLAFEIGFGQFKKIEKILQKGSKLQIIDVIRDYANIERVVIAQKV